MNFSYSAWNVYKSSQLQFYFQYIEKAKPSNEAMQVYGAAGNAVHSAIEDYIQGKGNTLQFHWLAKKVDQMTGIRGAKLSKERYKIMYDRAIEKLDDPMIHLPDVQTEKKFEFYFHGMMIKGFIDIFIDADNPSIWDWKTNSTNSYLMHKDQRLFYAWAIWKLTGKLSSCRWFYLKNNISQSDFFTEDHLMFVENAIKLCIDELKAKGTDINRYDIGKYSGPFNVHYNLCKEEEARRLGIVQKYQPEALTKITLKIKGNFVFIEGAPEKLLEGIDFKTKFDLKDKFWMQKKAREKGGFSNLKDVGTVHLFNRNAKCFPVGLMNTVKKVILDYNSFYKQNLKIAVQDLRDKKVMESKVRHYVVPELRGKILRDYQLKAVNSFMVKEHGIINIATGGGKTLIAAEIIRRAETPTLWIIDRKELLAQTKAELSKLLQIKIGEISGDVMDIGVTDVTIATIQSLSNHIDKLKDFLYNTNLVVVDEFHKSAAETYQKVFAKLPNTKYRLGLTATATRDDGKAPILFSILNDIVCQITTQELINMGYLVKPKIIFYKVDNPTDETTYAEEYKANIVEDAGVRNAKIIDIVSDAIGKKVLILTKMVAHGKYLTEKIPGSYHIHGSTSKDRRKQIMVDFKAGSIKCLVLTLSIGAEGLDIPDLDVIINAAANKGDVKSVQVLGRVLRIFKNKNCATYIDFYDQSKYLKKHAEARMRAFKMQGHEVTVR